MRSVVVLRGAALVAAAFASTTGAAARASLDDLPGGPWQPELVRRSTIVLDVAEARDGRVWLATKAGLRRFAGSDWRDEDPVGLGDRPVRRVLVARDGTLWIATGAAYVSYPERGDVPQLAFREGEPALVRVDVDGRKRSFGVADGLPSGWVLALAEDARGTLWVGTDAGLARLDGARFVAIAGTPATFALLAPAATGQPLLVGTTRGLARVEGEALVPTGLAAPIVALARDRSGGAWAAARQQVWRIDATGEIHGPAHDAGADVHAIAAARDAELWLGTGEGVARLTSAGALERVSAVAHPVTALAATSDGSAWIGTRDGGLWALRRGPLRSLGRDDGLGADVVFGVLASRAGAVWVTTTDGVVRIDGGTVTRFRYGADVPSYGLRAIAEAADGSIWFSSGLRGLVRHTGNRFQAYGSGEGVPAADVRAVHAERSGALWVGFADGAVVRYGRGAPGGEARVVALPAPCTGAEVRSFAAGAGHTWIATARGLARVDGEDVRCIGAQDGLPFEDVSAAVELGDGTVWVASFDDRGLARGRGGRFVSLGPSARLPAATVFSLLDDGAGRLWASSAQGVFRIGVAALEAAIARAGPVEPPPIAFDARDGMRSSECTAQHGNGLALDAAGRLWASTQSGLVVVDAPERARRAAVTLVVDDVMVAGRPESLVGARVTLPRGGASLHVRVTAARAGGDRRVHVERRLLPGDGAWTAVPDGGGVAFDRVPPGHWQLALRARDDLGVVPGAERAVEVVVPRPLWAEPSLLALAVVMIVAAGAAAHRARLRRQAERFEAVELERARIARDLHDHLAQGFASLALHLDGLRMALPADASDDVRARVGSTRALVEVAREQAKDAIWDIRRATGAPTDVAGVLRSTIADVPTGSASLRLRAADGALPIGPEAAHELGQLVREAVVNAIRHASAREIAVEASRAEGELHVRVVDDGRGISAEPASSGRGAGVLGMRERAARLGGSLVIESAPGAGTAVELRLPIAALTGARRDA